MLKKNLTPLYVREQISYSREVWEKILPIQTKSVKSPTPHSPTNVQWSCQPFRGWGKKRIWHCSKCHPSTKWLARVHHVVVFKTKVLHFKIENTPIKDTNGKRKFKRMLSFLRIRYDIVFRGIQPCFLRIGALGLFWTNKAAWFPWGHLRYIPYSMIKQNYVFKGEFLYFKGFMDGFYILTSAWKKNHKICFWNWFFAMCSTDLTCVNATI